ncbi:unnamed protein product [Closterium sp. NIES-65]|nr:unnamed protein product [Closterium sp. NIES-65]
MALKLNEADDTLVKACLPAAHEMALKLNEAYDTLIDDTRRASYEKEWRDAAVAGYVGFTGQPCSAWAASEGQQQAIFVDEAACISGWV